MKNKTTYYQFILDMSGSMSDVRYETIENYNQHINKIKSLQEEFPDQKFAISLCVFNDEQKNLLIDKAVGKIKAITAEDYRPDNSTALLDTIGKCVNRIREDHGAEILRNEASVVTVIITDGYENASMHYTYPEISRMIKQLEEEGKWTFTFLGADIDAEHIGSMLSVKKSNTRSFSKKQMGSMMNVVSDSLHDYACSKKQGIVNQDFLKNIENEN